MLFDAAELLSNHMFDLDVEAVDASFELMQTLDQVPKEKTHGSEPYLNDATHTAFMVYLLLTMPLSMSICTGTQCQLGRQ